jgi:hypothetical protein
MLMCSFFQLVEKATGLFFKNWLRSSLLIFHTGKINFQACRNFFLTVVVAAAITRLFNGRLFQRQDPDQICADDLLAAQLSWHGIRFRFSAMNKRRHRHKSYVTK